MSGISLTAATRSNLLTLQTVADQQAKVQSTLATGKRVSSAIDNPINFFTAAQLSDRRSDLSGLLDGLSNGIQTLQAASRGLEAIENLVQLGRSLAMRAAAAPSAVSTPAAITSVSDYTIDDVVGAQPAIAAASGPQNLAGVKGTLTQTAIAGPLDATPGRTVTVRQARGATVTYEVRSPVPTPPGNFFSDASELADRIRRDFAATVTLSADPATVATIAPTGDDQAITVDGDAIDPVQPGPMVTKAADTFRYAVNNGPPVTFTVRTPADPANGFFNSPATLRDAINARAGPSAPSAGLDLSGTRLVLVAADKDDTFQLSGSGSTLSHLGFTQPASYTYQPTPSLDTKSITYTLGKGVEERSVTVPFGYEAQEVTTLAQLNARLSTADMIATIEPSPNGKVVVRGISGREADTITLRTPDGEAPPSGMRILTGSDGPLSVSSALSEPGASLRRSLARDYAEIRDQISALARDSSFNGQNLLMGANVRLPFNEDGSSQTEVAGARMDADGLGLLTSLDGEFLDAASIRETMTQLQAASIALRSKSSEFSTAHATISTRRDFSAALTNILAAGAAKLVDGDMNQAAASANALALRRQIATSSLGLATQAQQAVLQLLRG